MPGWCDEELARAVSAGGDFVLTRRRPSDTHLITATRPHRADEVALGGGGARLGEAIARAEIGGPTVASRAR